MFDEPGITADSIIVGLFAGLGMGILLYILDIPIVFVGKRYGGSIAPQVNLGISAAMGKAALRDCNASGRTLGLVIGLALVFVLNGICGVAMFRGAAEIDRLPSHQESIYAHVADHRQLPAQELVHVQ